jgi:hypothetical protein
MELRGRMGHLATENGDRRRSPSEPVCEAKAVEMLPGKTLKGNEGQLIKVETRLYVPRTNPLKESLMYAVEALGRDNARQSKFGKALESWNSLIGVL